MAKPDKTDILNAYVAHSMNEWAKATVDLDRERNRQRHSSGTLTVDHPILSGPVTSLGLLKSK